MNVVDFDEKYIVSASGDRTIKVWSTSSCEFVRTLNGHKRGIACLQYHDRLVVSGSSDNTIRLWDIECGACLRVLEGHEELVRCIRFDSKRIVSGKIEFRHQVQLRFSLLEISCQQTDAFPKSLCVRVNGKVCPLPNPLPAPAGTEPRRPPGRAATPSLSAGRVKVAYQRLSRSRSLKP